MTKYLSALIFNTSLILFALFSFDSNAKEQSLRIAVASSFKPVLEKISTPFSEKYQVKLDIISGSSGTLFQQVHYGAPFDLFLSADSARPEQLAKNKLIIEGSLATYAQGQLALFSPSETPKNIQFLQNYRGALAIANPKIAPYGQAASQLLTQLKLSEKFRLIVGKNVGQTYQQVNSGNVPLGIVSLGQLRLNQQQGFVVPQHYYQPIKQKMVITKQSQQPKLAKQFAQFLLSDSVQRQLHKLGYAPINEEQMQ